MQLDSYVSAQQRSRRKRRRYIVGVIGFLAVYFLMIIVGWVVLRSPVFRVGHIVVTGNTTVPADGVISLLQSAALKGHNFWNALLGFDNMLAWPKALTAGDLKFIPQLKNVSVERDYFSHTLNVKVTERTPFGVWCFSSNGTGGTKPAARQCYWFSDEGIIFARAGDTEGSLFFTVEDMSQPPSGLNLKILPDQFVPGLISILKVLHASGVSVAKITLADISHEEITVTNAKGPALYFSLRFPADNDLPVLEDLMSQAGFSKLQYIDFRTQNRVYYK